MSEWDRSLDKLVAELDSLLEQKRALENRIDKVMQAAVLLEELAGRAPSISGAIGEKVSDKIRHVLLRSEIPLTAVEIKGQLAALGFKFPGDPRPMATIHSALHRLVTAKKPVIEAALPRGGRKAWRRAIWRRPGDPE